MTVSVAIITLNEESNLARTLQSVLWADELVIVDSGSEDRTVAIAKNFGARVFREPWKGFGVQKNSALEKCTCDWILSLDADEEVTPALATEVRGIVGATSGDATAAPPPAYYIPRRNYFLGQWLKFGGMYPDAKLRFFRRDLFTSGAARFAERPVHEDVLYQGETRMLRGDLLHHAYPTLTSYLAHLNLYSSLAAEGLVAKFAAESRHPSAAWFAAQTLFNPYFTFLYNYGLRGGFLDGRAGLLYHAYHSGYISWKYSKAWQMQRDSR
jgi:glycosyltransferase involved in cell wall biosynthesis